ncbi:uncharacterized protein TRIVIDRAFT_200569 [Trichoderma virens Gv29-8]|uniref:Uncharacterized protein n=1 Tax=Hypocrea virens (strain Gv29-8 / FGSC 10586) TaxID=413071 RepID=G9MSS3_HYPVG|nr:uncharacterized protein TRIVIDRAFT_200569 [Trichoderma virens Gv29-8]EHK22233.1 hypothetical protein TRIVIDRAFT_200569 [Trichoderma virens Gv29-8]UKZ47273.1 hypothetical protein TrVGV298_001490 [Trichoderma virens]
MSKDMASFCKLVCQTDSQLATLRLIESTAAHHLTIPSNSKMPQTRKAAQKARAQSKADTATQTTTQTQRAAQVEHLRPISLHYAPGNILWDDNDINGNVAGMTSIAYAAVLMLETIVDNKASEADREEAKKMLEYIGGSEKVKEFGNKLQQRVAEGSGERGNGDGDGDGDGEERGGRREEAPKAQEAVAEQQGDPTKSPYFK